MNRNYVLMVLCLFFVLMGACDSGGGHLTPRGEELGRLVAERFARIGTRLGSTWDVLGLMRSITIQPQHRTRFLQGVVDDTIVVLEEVAKLSAYCEVEGSVCRRFLERFEDVGDRFAGVTEEFQAVCTPKRDGEEQVLEALIQRAACIFSDCWSRVLKVETAVKTNE